MPLLPFTLRPLLLALPLLAATTVKTAVRRPP